MNIIYKTEDGIEIFTEPGRKSINDFKVRYRYPGKRIRTPKHIHIVIDILIKREHEKELTNQLLDEIINMIKVLKPTKNFPPFLQYFNKGMAAKYDRLNGKGEYEVEFLLVIVELIMIQEKTNYPNGNMNNNLFRKIRNNFDIFSIVSAATFK